MNERVQGWLYSKGVYNAVVIVDRKYFRINAHQITLSTTTEIQSFPQHEPPDCLIDLIRAGDWQ